MNASTRGRTAVTVVGAGPYGLSAAAHLQAHGLAVRVLGEPMDTWRSRMPSGMFLKSNPSASSIADPSSRYSLSAFRAAHGLPDGGDLHPVPIDEFIRYGEWFQERCVPSVDRSRVEAIGPDPNGFRVSLESGEEFASRCVVLATGLPPFAHVPAELSRLTESGLVSHTSDHARLQAFAGRRVLVIGAGQSALESAALLHEAGAEPTLVARTRRPVFNPPPSTDRSSDRPLTERLRAPGTPLGPGWRVLGYAYGPRAFRHLPAGTRERLVHTVLGPAGAWWLRERVEGRVPMLTGHTLDRLAQQGSGVRLTLRDGAGRPVVLEADHVLSATGYRTDVGRLEILGPELRRAVRQSAGGPLLNAFLESSVPGLYFTGLAAAPTFGPVLRFVCGTGFAARRVTAGVLRANGGSTRP
ncbi:FAD-dependent oxidoreductase [Kitasatospora sp. NPDC127111]|uniref:FAD-dependent oxidoreductase n=1 Tax=Kitasatospora sp. NPDC127111 TaxID=3345363 RepID=UPI00363C9E11